MGQAWCSAACGVRAANRAIVEFLRPIPSVALIVLVGLLLGPGLQTSR